MKTYYRMTEHLLKSKHMYVKIRVYAHGTYWTWQLPNGIWKSAETKTKIINDEIIQPNIEEVFERMWKYVPQENIEYTNTQEEIRETCFW